jgi:Uma2 family endonuclease
MASLPNVYLTPDEYLAREREAETRSEYFRGEIFAMAGTSRRHNLITTNLIRELSLQLKDRPSQETSIGTRLKPIAVA